MARKLRCDQSRRNRMGALFKLWDLGGSGEGRIRRVQRVQDGGSGACEHPALWRRGSWRRSKECHCGCRLEKQQTLLITWSGFSPILQHLPLSPHFLSRPLLSPCPLLSLYLPLLGLAFPICFFLSIFSFLSPSSPTSSQGCATCGSMVASTSL